MKSRYLLGAMAEGQRVRHVCAQKKTVNERWEERAFGQLGERTGLTLLSSVTSYCKGK